MSITFPKVCRWKNGKYYIDFKLHGKRYRLQNGNKIKLDLKPNNFPQKFRKQQSELLAQKVFEFLIDNNMKFHADNRTDQLMLFDEVIEKKLDEPLSTNYRKTLSHLSSLLRKQVVLHDTIPVRFIETYLHSYDNNTSYNNVRRHLNVLLNSLKHGGFQMDEVVTKSRKQTEQLHKPISNLAEVFAELKEFNQNLYLCCLLTYGCLLRPHREIRLLKWKDFSSDLKYISIDGSRVKSKRNRIVPVPDYIQKELECLHADWNVFSQTHEPFNNDYFKTLWGRFKRVSTTLDKCATLYSFRHTGAIEVFKRTGSISKLQAVMGHSSIKVSLTYLRGLEVPELNEEDMPMI